MAKRKKKKTKNICGENPIKIVSDATCEKSRAHGREKTNILYVCFSFFSAFTQQERQQQIDVGYSGNISGSGNGFCLFN